MPRRSCWGQTLPGRWGPHTAERGQNGDSRTRAGPAGGEQAPGRDSAIPAEPPRLRAPEPRQSKAYEGTHHKLLRKLESCQCPAHPITPQGPRAPCLSCLPGHTDRSGPLEGWKSSTQIGLHEGSPATPLLPPVVAGQKVSWAVRSDAGRHGRAGGYRAEGNCFSGPAEPGIGTWGPGPGRRRKASDVVRGRGVQQAVWPHGPAGPVDISAPTLLTSVCSLRWSPNTCLTPTAPELGRGRTRACGACAHLPRKDLCLALPEPRMHTALPRASAPHTALGAQRAQLGDPCPQTKSDLAPSHLKQGETSSFRNGLRTLKRRHVQIF